MNRSFCLSYLILLATSFAMAPIASAQLDSSSALLLRAKSKSPSATPNLDSSRYKIRAPESRRDDDDLDEKPGTVIPTPVKASVQATTTMQVTSEPPTPAASVPAAVPSANAAEQPAVIAPVTPQPAPADPLPEAFREQLSVSEQLKALFLGGRQEEIEDARAQIHPQDPRANTLGISLAPAYFYTGSDSGYSFRDYTSHGPGLGLGANIWLTPFFGVQSRFFSSVSSSIRSGQSNMVSLDVQTFDAGLRFRKHFGYSRKAAHLTWGIDYYDKLHKIGKEADTAVGHKSAGLSVSLEAVVPTSVTYAHTLNMEVRPRLKHTEMNTGTDARSGSSNETNAVSFGLGGQWTLDRRNQVFWKTQYSVERNLFKGEASLPDAASGATPDGVSVTDSLVIFYFGFKWGS